MKELVTRIVALAQALSEKRFYGYQVELTYRIVESLLLHDGETLTSLMARQAGKTECLGAIAAAIAIIFPKLAKEFPDDWRLNITDNNGVYRGFNHGVSIGIYAPRMDQSQTMFDRVRKATETKTAKKIMREAGVAAEISNGERMGFSNGSTILCQSASEQSKIEGKTHHLLIEEEAQDISDIKIRKSLSPMVAATMGTTVMIGTATNQKCDFYSQIKTNERSQLITGKRNHFFFPYQIVLQYNSLYAKHIEKERIKLGDDSDEFRMCLAPETKVLTKDLHHIPASEITVGMKLIGFDEEVPFKGGHRKIKETVVESVSYPVLPCYELVFSDGTKIVCSSDHGWLVFTSGSRTVWKKTKDLNRPRYKSQKSVDKMFKITDVWEELNSKEAGYLAAAFDGEGNHKAIQGHHQLCFNQNDNVMLSKVKEYLDKLGYKYFINKSRKCHRVILNGGRASIMKFLGEIRPERLLKKLDIDTLGSIGRHDFASQNFSHPTIVKKTFLGNKKTVAFRTSTRTFIAEGLASHNSYGGEWIFERGMFVTHNQLFSKGVAQQEGHFSNSYIYGLPRELKYFSLVAGIDWGRSHDSTVLTLAAVDWNNPLDSGYYVDENGEREFTFYRKHIVGWIEFIGDNYEHQFWMIHDYLKSLPNLKKIVMDSNTCGLPIFDRFAAVFGNKVQVEPCNFSAKVKSDLYKSFYMDICGKRFTFPASKTIRQTREYRKFCSQMVDLRKTYKNGLMQVEHPEEKDAHDDYPDSAALACWGAGTPSFQSNFETHTDNFLYR